MRVFKIEGDSFLAKDISIQLRLHGMDEFDLTLSVENNDVNKNYFFNIYDKKPHRGFNITCDDFLATGCVIKSITLDSNLIIMDILTGESVLKPISQRRDEKIDNILKH